MNAHEYIDDYCNGKLTGENLIAFEQLMKKDPELALLVKNYQNVFKVSEGALELQLLNEVEDVGRTETTNPNQANLEAKKMISSRYGRLPWIILIVGLVALGIFLLSLMNEKELAPSEEQLFAELYQEPIWPMDRSNQKNQLSNALATYLDGDLNGAKSILLDSIADKKTATYWLSEIYMKEMEFDSVRKYLPKEIPGNKRMELLKAILIHD